MLSWRAEGGWDSCLFPGARDGRARDPRSESGNTSDRWKLNLCAGDQGELFDLRSDPYEQTNLFDDPAQRDRVRDIAARIRMWQPETGDVVASPGV